MIREYCIRDAYGTYEFLNRYWLVVWQQSFRNRMFYARIEPWGA